MPKQEDGIKFDRSVGVQREISGEVLTTFAAGRRDEIAELDAQLRDYAEQVRAMIPGSLSAFSAESHFADVETLMKLITTLGMPEENVPYATLSAKLKEPEVYGFRDKDDAYRGMLELREAWKGVLDVEVSKSDWYVEVWVRGLGKNA